MSFLSIKDINLIYNENSEDQEVRALDHISVDIDKGEFVTILGASGCGKTSLLNIIAGFLFPNEGKILLNGEAIEGPGRDRGVVFQQNALLPWLSVNDNITLGLKFSGENKQARTRKAKEVLELVGLSEFGENYVYQLSGGMQQRVGIARALANDPKMMLLDEPLGALDAITREDVQKNVLEIWDKSHKTVVMVTHSIEEALFMGTKVIIMTPRPGRIHKIYDNDFPRRFIQGESAKSIKADDKFLKLKQEILNIVKEEA